MVYRHACKEVGSHHEQEVSRRRPWPVGSARVGWLRTGDGCPVPGRLGTLSRRAWPLPPGRGSLLARYDEASERGPVAQLGARLNGIQKVRGSNPLGSTSDHALHQPAMPSLAISVSRSQAGDDVPTDVATSWGRVGSSADRSPPLSLPDRLVIHRKVRAASA
jgi:hypothetical protein